MQDIGRGYLSKIREKLAPNIGHKAKSGLGIRKAEDPHSRKLVGNTFDHVK
jgi:hypothetical protein